MDERCATCEEYHLASGTCFGGRSDPDHGWGPLLTEAPERRGVDAEHFTMVLPPALSLLGQVLASDI